MAWAILLFGFSGRINRGKFWLAWLIYLVIHLVLTIPASLTDSTALSALNGMVTIVIIVSSLAVVIKRLQDRNKSGWYVLLFYAAPALLFVAGIMIGSTVITHGLWLIAFALSVWGFIELGCLRGTIGANPYGPDPVAPKPAVH
jgi:uncharacterized membrane protein YhaH (DUF805 family)